MPLPATTSLTLHDMSLARSCQRTLNPCQDIFNHVLLYQAESDHHVRDTLNYMTVQTDVAMPSRALEQVQDPSRVQPWRDALRWAVAQVQAEDKDVRVLNLGASAGASAAHALRADVRSREASVLGWWGLDDSMMLYWVSADYAPAWGAEHAKHNCRWLCLHC